MTTLSRRFVCLLLVSLLTVISVFACGKNLHHNTANWTSSLNDCRIVKHSMGETCIPENPERLVTIFHVTLGNVLALGVKPIGSATALNTSQEDLPAYLKHETAGIKQLGSQYQPNLETILLAKPDLILGWETVRKTYPLISQIGPTVLGQWQGESSWREYFHFVAEVLGKEEAEQQAWLRYYQRVDELKTALSKQYKNKTVSVIYAYRGSPTISINTKNSFVGSILEDAGIQRPETQNITVPGGSYDITEESLHDADADVLFILSNDQKTVEALQQKPIWKILKAVQQRRVYPVDDFTWIGSNLIAANAVIDDLFKYLVNMP
ncbi:iron-siderophore ABC transporter substrate-binding protein [Leptolyngbya sp. 7M]|uniref:iron-siderophore ABC transporter substrate-binding protein n=1 Tax=Leptolyngbya sp. 7M TaxID=2812896 RepID=UPI001B8C6399|nr:iron-siderophore ABC transporter substrate-binding protein [Leptolyngbya sp. 7M]QYO67379.1 iron-siderophore ABC transporter substrate-binding protein [Leptolyngbya sp. 7M]